MTRFAPITMFLAAAFCVAAAGSADALTGRPVSLDVPFDPDRLCYTAAVAAGVTEVTVDALARHPAATLTVNGNHPAAPVSLAPGVNTIVVVVTAEDGQTQRVYTLKVTRLAPGSAASDPTNPDGGCPDGAVADDGADTPQPQPPTLTLTAAPAAVHEGSQFTITARLTSPLPHAVTIPLTVTRDTSEAGDHDTLTAIAIPAGFPSAAAALATHHDADADDERFTVAVDAPNLPGGILLGIPYSAPLVIRDHDPAPQPPGTSLDNPAAGTAPAALSPHATLVADVRAWRNDPQWVSFRDHTDRWDRVLLALGEDVSDPSLAPMTATEAQGYADRGWTRWQAVATALAQLESGAAPPAPDIDATVTISASPNPVGEGSPVRVTVTLDQALSYALLIPIAVTGGTAEAGDHGSLPGIRIEAGLTSAAAHLTTSQDADTDDDTFTVAIDPEFLPSEMAVGDPSSVTVTITDHDKTQTQQANDPPESEDPPPHPGGAPGQLNAGFIGTAWDRRASNPNPQHVERWDRVLLALGEPVSSAWIEPMTVEEALNHYNLDGWQAWGEVAQVLDAVLTGSSADDSLAGTATGELLVGLGGNDDLSGGGGNDELRGGRGDDDLTGGEGRDRFVFFPRDTGAKVITDFQPGTDVIVLKGSGWPSPGEIAAYPTALDCCGYRYSLIGGLTVETTNNRSLATEDFVLEDLVVSARQEIP